MTSGSVEENARTLAALLGVKPEEAASLLKISIAVTYAADDFAAARLAGYLAELLGRTVDHVDVGLSPGTADAEIVVGSAIARTLSAIRIHATERVISIGPNTPIALLDPDLHPLLLLLAACYGVAAVLRAALGGRLPIAGPAAGVTFTMPTDVFFGVDRRWLNARIDLEETHLAGAGAIGNGFLYALCTLNVTGRLHVVDFDAVGDGNLNRCVWFQSGDIDADKARRLVDHAQPHFSNLTLVPHVMELQELGKAAQSDSWLKRLVVGVDSRRARRRLQSEIPREVFDASTTGAEEIVLHHHKQPTDDACLACIYHESPDELSRERSIANNLGVTLAEVQEHVISSSAAAKIIERYPRISATDVIGKAYDSLFKALCSEQALKSSDDRQVFAPFAFVSVLAGVCLAIELGRRLTIGPEASTYNYWRVSPWGPPVAALKQIRQRLPDCEFCSVSLMRQVTQNLWGHETND